MPMTVLNTSAVFEKKWLATQIDAGAACPILEGNVGRSVATTEIMSLVFSLGIWGSFILGFNGLLAMIKLADSGVFFQYF